MIDRGGRVDWKSLDSAVTDVLVLAGVAVLIVRQFVWRPADPRRILRTPLAVLGAGAVLTVVQLHVGRWEAADWILLAELVLVAMTGAALGSVTRFRGTGADVRYRPTGPGLALWLGFIGIRAASFALASALGADVGGASGLVLLSFGVNRLGASLVVRRRLGSRTAAEGAGAFPRGPALRR